MTESRRWGRAGERLTPEQIRQRDYQRVQRQQRRERLLADARRRWAAGLVVPHRITTVLDLGNHYGPEVDRACGVEEPTVDMWEAAELYPTWEQLCALAKYTELLPGHFTTAVRIAPINTVETSLRFHVRGLHPDPPPILRYPADIVRACPGTNLATQTEGTP